MLRFGEIAVTAQRLIDGLVAVELPAVIIGDGVYHGFEVRQQIGDGLAGQVGFPIAQPGACRHDSRALVNIHPARNTSPVVGATVFFPVRLALVAQLPV